MRVMIRSGRVSPRTRVCVSERGRVSGTTSRTIYETLSVEYDSTGTRPFSGTGPLLVTLVLGAIAPQHV